MTESSTCPSSYALLRLATCPHEADDGVAMHVAGCPACGRIVAEQRARGEAYISSPNAEALRQKLQNLQAEATRKTERARPSAVWAWGGAVAAAASLALVFSSARQQGLTDDGQPASRSSKPSAHGPIDSLKAKGDDVQLTLWVADEAGADVQLGDAAVLHAGQRVQPTFATSTNGFVALVLTTPAGVVVPLYPGGRTQSALLKAGPPAPLGPSFRLDEEIGLYRVTAYFSKSSFSTIGLPVLHPKNEAVPFAGIVSTRKFEVRP